MQGSFYLPCSGGIFHIYLALLGTDFIGVSLQSLEDKYLSVTCKCYVIAEPVLFVQTAFLR